MRRLTVRYISLTILLSLLAYMTKRANGDMAWTERYWGMSSWYFLWCGFHSYDLPTECSEGNVTYISK